MPSFSIIFVRSRPGIDRSLPDWDDGLDNFGYEEYDGVAPVHLTATTIDEARIEAASFVQERVSPTAPPEGYWIVEGERVVELILVGEPSS